MNWWEIVKGKAKGSSKRLNHPVFTMAVGNVIKDRTTFTIPQITEEVIREYAALLIEGNHMKTAQANKHARARTNKEQIGKRITKIGSHKRHDKGIYKVIE